MIAQEKTFLGAVVGLVVSAGGPAAAVALGDGWAVLAWSPLLAFFVAVAFMASEEHSAVGKGFLVGTAVGLIVGAGICVGTFRLE